jgi:hypothetical protein
VHHAAFGIDLVEFNGIDTSWPPARKCSSRHPARTFGSYRQVAKEAVFTLGAHPIEEEKFPDEAPCAEQVGLHVEEHRSDAARVVGAGERLRRSCGCLFSISGKSLRGPRCSLALGQFLWVVVLSLGSSPTVFLPEWEAMELQLFPAKNMDNMDFYNFYMRR